jgi:DNA helicase-2/ATP-dependent DNA helicase PcrA
MQPWDDIADDDADESWEDWQIEDVAVEQVSDSSSKPAISIVAASIKTAAALERETNSDAVKRKELPRVSPDVFRQGMTVTHPEYGPGKIVALSGADKNRRATIQFATVGQKKIILAHSAVRPVQ